MLLGVLDDETSIQVVYLGNRRAFAPWVRAGG